MKDLALTLGRRIQYFRKKNNIPLKELAELIHTTPSLISQIERGKAKPSLSTLNSIANIFEIPISLFFDYDDNEAESPLVRKNAHKRVITKDNVSYRLLTSKINDVEVILIEFPPDTASSASLHKHEGAECGYLLKGELTIEMEDQAYTMYAGDSISVESFRGHRLVNKGDDTVIAIWTNVKPLVLKSE